MSRILWTPLALEDLEGISLYIEGKSTLATANRVCPAIYDTVQRLRHFPEIGKAGIENGTLEFVVPDFPAYIVAYRLGTHDSVQVLRVGTERSSVTKEVAHPYSLSRDERVPNFA